MSYSSPLPEFPTNILVAQSAIWLAQKPLSSLLAALNSVYFPIVDSRQTGLEVLNSLVSTPPFSYDPPVRFPPFGAYLTGLDPVFDRLISQIRSALQYKDRLLEKTNIGNQVCSVTSNTPAYMAAFNSFHNGKLELIKFVNDYNNYYYRTNFELLYSLTWS